MRYWQRVTVVRTKEGMRKHNYNRIMKINPNYFFISLSISNLNVVLMRFLTICSIILLLQLVNVTVRISKKKKKKTDFILTG